MKFINLQLEVVKSNSCVLFNLLLIVGWLCVSMVEECGRLGSGLVVFECCLLLYELTSSENEHR